MTRFASIFVIMARVAVGVPLLIAGVAKARQPYLFLYSVYDFQLIDFATGELIAAWLPWVEITIAICLLAGLWLTETFLLSLVMLTTFLLAQASAQVRGLEVACGCFGPSLDDTIGARSMLRVGAMMAATVVGLIALQVRKNRTAEG